MKPTELLITAYDGDRSLFTTNLTPERARTIVTGVDRDGDTVVAQVSEKETQAFESITQILLDVVNPVGVYEAGRYQLPASPGLAPGVSPK